MEKNRKNESYSDYLVRHRHDKNLTGVEKGDLTDTLAVRKKENMFPYAKGKKVPSGGSVKLTAKKKGTKKKVTTKR